MPCGAWGSLPARFIPVESRQTRTSSTIVSRTLNVFTATRVASPAQASNRRCAHYAVGVVPTPKQWLSEDVEDSAPTSKFRWQPSGRVGFSIATGG